MKALQWVVLVGGLLMVGTLIYVSFSISVALGLFTLGCFVFAGGAGLIKLLED